MGDVKVSKSDIFISMIGTSPMPNLLGVCTRVKENGTVFMIHTKATKGIANRLKDVISKKNTSISVELCQLNNHEQPDEVYKNLMQIMNGIFKKMEGCGGNFIIELNYTGGTKVMSSMAYDIFTDRCIESGIKGYLSYFDGEKSEVIIKDVLCGSLLSYGYSKENEILPLCISDVVDVHFSETDIMNQKVIDDYSASTFEKVIYDIVLNNMGSRKDVIAYLEDMRIVGKGEFDEEKEKWVRHKKDRFKEVLNGFIKNGRYKIDGFDTADDIFEAYRQMSPSNIKEKDLLTIIQKSLEGFWFENIVNDFAFSMKEDGLIDDIISNISKKKTEKGQKDFEVDTIIMKNHKLYCISITTCDEEEDNIMKLYEIKLRSEMLGGVEAHPILLTFYNDVDMLKDKIKNIWDKSAASNISIIGWDDIDKIRERLCEIVG